jgi:glycosyltransferase 2 family protein
VRGEWDLLSAYLRGNFDGARNGIKIRKVSGSDLGSSASLELSPWKRNWPFIRRVLTIILLISVLTYLGIKGFAGLKEIYQSGITFHLEYLAVSFLCQLVGVMLAAMVWSNILKRLEVNSNYWFDLQAFCISALAKKVPGMVVYAVSRLVMYSTIQASKIRVTLAMVIEMAMIALAGLLVFAISAGGTILPASWNLQGPVVTVIIISLVLLACLAVPAVIRLMIRLTQGKTTLVASQSSLQINFLTSFFWLIGEIGVVILAGGVGYFLVKSIELPDSIPYSSILRAFSLSVALGPLSVWLPGDIGLRDGIMFLALKPFTSASIAALITLIYRFWLSLLEVSFGFIAGVTFKRRK